MAGAQAFSDRARARQSHSGVPGRSADAEDRSHPAFQPSHGEVHRKPVSSKLGANRQHDRRHAGRTRQRRSSVCRWAQRAHTCTRPARARHLSFRMHSALVEHMPRDENPSRAVQHHIGADGPGALALRGAAGDDHRLREARVNGNGLVEHPLGSINVQREGGRASRASHPRTRVGRRRRRKRSSLPTRPPSAARSRRDGSHCERHARGVANHCNPPRSRKADRSTPGGANQPPAPYLAPSFNATSLLP